MINNKQVRIYPNSKASASCCYTTNQKNKLRFNCHKNKTPLVHCKGFQIFPLYISSTCLLRLYDTKIIVSTKQLMLYDTISLLFLKFQPQNLTILITQQIIDRKIYELNMNLVILWRVHLANYNYLLLLFTKRWKNTLFVKYLCYSKFYL